MPRWLQLLVVATGAYLSLATPARPPHPFDYPRGYPVWLLEPDQARLGCAEVKVWVAKSGKSGIGVTVRARNATAEPCRFAVAAVSLALRSGVTVGAPAALEESDLAPGALTYAYVALPFDHERAWNGAGGRLDGELRVQTTAGTLHLAATELREAAHRTRRRDDELARRYLEP